MPLYIPKFENTPPPPSAKILTAYTDDSFAPVLDYAVIFCLLDAPTLPLEEFAFPSSSALQGLQAQPRQSFWLPPTLPCRVCLTHPDWQSLLSPFFFAGFARIHPGLQSLRFALILRAGFARFVTLPSICWGFTGTYPGLQSLVWQNPTLLAAFTIPHSFCCAGFVRPYPGLQVCDSPLLLLSMVPRPHPSLQGLPASLRSPSPISAAWYRGIMKGLGKSRQMNYTGGFLL
jgi:hypothetical protein